MPLYIYKAVNREGQLIKNKVEEINRFILLKKLKKNGYMPIDVTQIRMSTRANRIMKKQRKNVEGSNSVLKDLKKRNLNIGDITRREIFSKQRK